MDKGIRLRAELAMGHAGPYLPNKLPPGTKDLTGQLPKAPKGRELPPCKLTGATKK